jgi:hypothetical protein
MQMMMTTHSPVAFDEPTSIAFDREDRSWLRDTATDNLDLLATCNRAAEYDILQGQTPPCDLPAVEVTPLAIRQLTKSELQAIRSLRCIRAIYAAR